MNPWGLFILAAGALLILLGITGKAESALNGARVRSGNPAKSSPITAGSAAAAGAK